MHVSRLYTGITVGVLTLGTLPAVGNANVLEEVTVTAQKREQSLQDVGVAVTAFTESQIRDLNFTNTVDITAQTPSLQLYEWSPTYTVFNIRGVSQNDFADHLEPPVAVYMDDSYISMPGALNGPLFDMQRVEVLRGPQGTLFGRNATGGLIRFISNMPTKTPTGYVIASVGERDLLDVQAAISGPLVNDKILGRLAVQYQQQDGSLKTNIRDIGGKDGTAARGHLQFFLSDSVELLISGRWARNDDMAAGGYARDPAAAGPDGLGVSLGRGDPYENTLNQRGFLDKEVYGASAKFTWDIRDSLEFVSITDYSTLDKLYIEDTDATEAPGFAFSTFQDFRQYSQEFRLSGGSDRLNWVTGVYYLDMHSENGGGVNGYAVSGYSLFIGGTRGLWINDVESYSAFGQLDFALTDQFTLVAGLRYSNDDKTHVFNARHFSTDSPVAIDYFDNDDGPTLTVEETCDYFFAPGDPNVPACIAAGGYYSPVISYDPSTDPDAARTFDDVSAKVQIEWRPNDDMMFYAGINRGTKGGNWATPVIFPLNTESFAHDSETLTSYEIGSKITIMDGRGRFNTAAFYYDYEDYQGFTLVNLAQEVINLDAEVIGLEAEFVFSPIDGLDLSAGVAFLDSTVKDFTKPNGDVVDRELPQAPPFSMNFIARYAWPAFGGTLAAQLDGKYMDDQYLGLDNAPINREEAYEDLNARFSYSPANDNWTITAWIRNFTDNAYRIYSADVSAAGFGVSTYASPRTAGITFTYDWR